MSGHLVPAAGSPPGSARAAKPVLDIADLTVTLGTRDGPARAVAGVDWSVARGQTLALVGESGSGKSLTVLAATGLAPRSATVTGRVRLLGRELTTMSGARTVAAGAAGTSVSSSRTRRPPSTRC